MASGSELKFYKSANSGLGGDISATEITSGNTNNLFPNVTRAQQLAGFDEYLCMYLKNTSSETMKNVAVWLTQDTPGSHSTVKWSFEPSPHRYKFHPFGSYNGTSDFTEQADDPSLDLSAFSCAAWIKTSKDYVGGEGAIINKGGFNSEAAGQNMNYGIWVNTSNKVVAGFEDSSGNDRFVTDPGAAINDNIWHHVAVTYNGSSILRLYVDNDRVASLGTGTTPDTGANPLRIGKNSRADDTYFEGSIDEVRVWNIALTWDDIEALYNIGHALEIDNIVYAQKFGVNNNSRVAQPIASITTPPVGVTWNTIGSQPDTANIGTLGPSGYRPVWIWWHGEPNAPDVTNDRAIFNYRFDITTAGTGSSGGSGGGGGQGSGGNPPTISDGYKIAVTGDWGCKDETDDVVNQIIDGNYNLVIGVGDNSYASSAGCWIDRMERFDDADIIHKHAYGNHEHEESSGTSPYKSYLGNNKTYFSFDFQNVHVLVMDTNIDIDSGSNQYDFVVADLEAQDNRSNIDWIFAVMHHPWLGATDHEINEFDQVQTYFDLFLDHHVNFVFVGHNHNWQRTYPVKRNGSSASKVINNTGPYTVDDPNPWLIHVVSGAGGHDNPGSLYDLDNNPSYNAYSNNSNNGIFSLEASNNGQTLACKFINTSGTVKHSFTVNR